MYNTGQLKLLSHLGRQMAMKSNADKCKVLDTGSSNDEAQFSTNDQQLHSVNKVNDRGVIKSHDLEPSNHCTEVVKTMNKITVSVRRTSELNNIKDIRTLYYFLMGPHLEYCVQFWSYLPSPYKTA